MVISIDTKSLTSWTDYKTSLFYRVYHNQHTKSNSFAVRSGEGASYISPELAELKRLVKPFEIDLYLHQLQGADDYEFRMSVNGNKSKFVAWLFCFVASICLNSKIQHHA